MRIGRRSAAFFGVAITRLSRGPTTLTSTLPRFTLILLGWAIASTATGFASDVPAPVTPAVPCPGGVDDHFEDEVWAKVAARTCLTCHRTGGDAEKSAFRLIDPSKVAGAARTDARRHNRGEFLKIARLKEGDRPRMLLMVVGDLDHGGGKVVEPNSSEHRVLAEFVRRVTEKPAGLADSTTADPSAAPFFRGVRMLDDRRLLRRITLSLAGRLPTVAELERVTREGRAAIAPIMDGVMREEAFFERLREGFNDIFLTLGVDGNPDQTCLSYEHFEKTRHWYQHHDLSHIKDKDERQRTEWKIAAEYRKALLGEPMKLVEHIVRNDRPFTELVTADYIMVSPYTARGYGVFDEVKGKFKNSGDPFEYVPVKLKSLKGRSERENQDSATGFYPHAGVLSTFQYLTRYPTTETNRNRLRARMFYQHFLGVDVLELAARVSDAAQVTAKHKVPTMQAAECVVCHRTLDPVSGLFQDYWRFADQGVYGKRKEGWFTDMFEAGFEGEKLPSAERWRALAWLGERTAKDPRFAVAMVEHVHYILTGRRPLPPPKDVDDPLFGARRRAYAEQRRLIESIAQRFAANGFNLKSVFKDWALSDFYRVDGLETAASEPCRRAELDDLGLVRMLAPEQLERKVHAVFGERWNRLEGELAMLYGGIDSKEVTDRATDPGGAMGAIQRTLANDVACKQVARDFARPPKQRKWFAEVEPTTLPGASAAGDLAIRRTLARLHAEILGRADAADSEEVSRSFRLLAGIMEDAKSRKNLPGQEMWACRQGRPGEPPPPDDPHYSIRAWRSVMTYLLRRPEFLYE
jgi:hypothetical protein